VSVQVKTRVVGDISVVEVVGRITLGEGSNALRDTVGDLVTRNQKKILLNLQAVAYVDSSGIGELVAAYSSVTRSGGQFRLSNLTKRVKDLLRISRHDLLFDIHEEEASAVESFT